MEQFPTLIHVTHWKAGSQWIHKILRTCFPNNIIQPSLGNVQFVNQKIVSGGVYPTVYVTKEEFDTAILPENYYKFIVIRDLRDTLISGYYSIKISHPPMGQIADWRKILNEVSLEDGLLFLMKNWLPDSAAIQQSWLNAREELIRYEDLLEHDLDLLHDLLINKAMMNIDPENLRTVILESRFENVTGGRKLGQENLHVHERKGIPGDWKNHFSDRIRHEFKLQFGDLLANTGYEANSSW